VLNASFDGLLTGLTLIVAIGAQNAYVLRQGLRRAYVGPVVAVCTVSDFMLIGAGVGGIGVIIQHAGWALTAFAYLVTRPALLPHGTVAAAVVPLSTAVILLGALSMVVRRHTVAQLIGWLIVENGVFLGAITLVATFPFIVEAGIFLDIVAGVLIMVVFVSGLTRQLAEASAGELRELRG